jgi:hypothetical protein
MIWLTLRQHRAQLIGLLGAAILLTVATWLFADYALRTRAELGVDACLTSGGQSSVFGGSCPAVFAEFQRRLGLVSWLFIAIYLAPALAAAYIGGPLFAAEFERATHRLAWTQGVSRLRWAAVKLGVVLAVALIATIILSAAVRPSRVLMGIGRSGAGVRPFDGFDFEAPVLVSYVVFGIVVAACTGAWSRRILAGMFVGLLVFGIARVAVYTVRPSYQVPVTVPYESLSRGYLVHPGDPTPPDQIPNDAWIVDVPAVDGEGRPVPREKVNELLSAYYRTPRASAPSLTNNDSTYLAEHGVYRRAGYQPADRYWTFQAIEAAIFTALAALFVLLTLWRVRSRDA